MLAPNRGNEYAGQPCQYQLKTSLQSVCRQDLVTDYLSQCPQAVRTCLQKRKKRRRRSGRRQQEEDIKRKKKEEAERLTKTCYVT